MRFCDMSCSYASFTDPELSGACRTFGAVYCGKLKTVTHKNMPCRVPEATERKKRKET